MHAPQTRVNTRQKEQERPRVNNNQQKLVLRPRQKEIPQEYSRGTYVYKAFNNKIHQGYIYDYDKYEGYYKVQHEDDDSEEYDKNELSKMLKKFDQNYQQAMAATRFERVQEQYTNTQASYNELSQFTGGYAKAIAHIEMGNYDNPVFQGYKYANAVINKETGKAMEYRDLIYIIN